MKKIIIHHSVINSIDKTRLIYTDFEGNQAQIRFDECRKNWVNYANSSTEFEKPDLKEEETCCVGWRDAFDKTAYIEFFTTKSSIRFSLQKNILRMVSKIAFTQRL